VPADMYETCPPTTAHTVRYVPLGDTAASDGPVGCRTSNSANRAARQSGIAAGFGQPVRVAYSGADEALQVIAESVNQSGLPERQVGMALPQRRANVPALGPAGFAQG
jgi:hypothetical protein